MKGSGSPRRRKEDQRLQVGGVSGRKENRTPRYISVLRELIRDAAREDLTPR